MPGTEIELRAFGIALGNLVFCEFHNIVVWTFFHYSLLVIAPSHIEPFIFVLSFKHTVAQRFLALLTYHAKTIQQK